ncbi:MAG: PKD domain-containing protein, partial [Candidatus Micrarchaeota archaeon]
EAGRMHSVNLKIETEDGKTASAEKTFVIDEPTANDVFTVNAGSSATVKTGEELEFYGSVSGITYSNVDKYEWDFDGDGHYDWNSFERQKVYHAYDTAGTYYAKFRVTDDDDREAWSTRKIIVESSEVEPETIEYDSLEALGLYRDYDYNDRLEATTVTLTVTNNLNEKRAFKVTDYIPKSLARNLAYVTITPEPDFIVSADPEFGWNVVLEPYGSFEAKYVFDKEISFEDVKDQMEKPATVQTELPAEEPEEQPQVDNSLTGFIFGALKSAEFGLFAFFAIFVLAVVFWKKEKIFGSDEES